jgi:hypothetical protein
MNTIRSNKFILGLLFAAVISLCVITIGGEYLHSLIHHHDTQESHQKCPITQFLAQVFIALGPVLAAVVISIVYAGTSVYRKIFLARPAYILPDSHAPPVSFL